MPDVDLRQLERAAAQGDREAGVRLLRERLRRGLLDEDRVALAAWLGDPAAQALRPEAAPGAHVDLVWFLDRLADWGRLTAVRGAVAFARWMAPEPERLGSIRVAIQGDRSALQVLVAGRSLVVGRGSQVDLRIREDESVSRRHCEVRLDTDGHVWVRDLDSKNGTWLGSEIVGAEPMRVYDGDLIRIGTSAIEVRGARGTTGEGWLEAAAEFLEAPGREAYERVDRRLEPGDPARMLPADQAAYGAAMAILAGDPAPGSLIDIRLSDDADARRAVARALLPFALRQEPLERIEEPPAPLCRVRGGLAHDRRYRQCRELFETIGLTAIRKTGGRGDSPIMARAADGSLESVAPIELDFDIDAEAWASVTRGAVCGDHRHLLGHLGFVDGSSHGLGLVRSRFVRGYGLPAWVSRRETADLGFVVRGFRDVCGAAQVAIAVVQRLPEDADAIRIGLDGRFYLAEAVAEQVRRDLQSDPWGHHEPLGSLAHITPEEATEAKAVVPGPAAVYRLASFLFLALTGRTAFIPASARVLLAILDEAPPAPSAIHPAVSPELDAVLLKALEKDPADRYPDPEAFAAALGETPEGRRGGGPRG